MIRESTTFGWVLLIVTGNHAEGFRPGVGIQGQTERIDDLMGLNDGIFCLFSINVNDRGMKSRLYFECRTAYKKKSHIAA